MCIVPVHSQAGAIGDYFRPPEAVAAAMSPHGDLVAIAKHIDNNVVVEVRDLNSNDTRTLFDAYELLSVKQSAIHQVLWIDNDYVAITITEDRLAVAELLNTKSYTSTYLARASHDETGTHPAIFEIKAEGNIVSALPDEAGVFLYSKAGLRSALYRIEIEKLNKLGQRMTRSSLVDGGQFIAANEVASYKGFVFRWFLDDSQNVVSVFAYSTSGDIEIAANADSGHWTTLRSWPDIESYLEADDNISPLAIGDDSDQYYVVSDSEGQSDGLFLERLSNGERTLVFRHPTADIYQVVKDLRSGHINAVGMLDRGNIRYAYIDDDLGLAADQLAGQFSGANIHLINQSPNGDRVLIEVQAFDRPGSFHSWDRKAEALQTLASAMPWLDEGLLAATSSGEVRSHGLEIPYLLTYPKNGQPPYPIILLPHGGPIGIADNNAYDPVAQLFASRGFAVLQVNYRGSAGYSDSFLEAGKREWGRKILDDILAAYREVQQRPEIDASRGCAVGGSYGGYAALMIAIRHPQLLQCAVSVSGVTDVNLVVSNPNFPKKTQQWVTEFVGDPISDFDELADISPVRLAAQSQVPILIAHGLQDRVVDVEHAARLDYALSKHGKSHELHIYPNIGHGVSGPEEAEALFGDVLKFLSENLEAAKTAR
jgi:acetyl esterase/lipase